MNARPMYGFIAGLFALLIALSLLRGGEAGRAGMVYAGWGFLVLGIALIAISLILQRRQRRDERK